LVPFPPPPPFNALINGQLINYLSRISIDSNSTKLFQNLKINPPSSYKMKIYPPPNHNSYPTPTPTLAIIPIPTPIPTRTPTPTLTPILI